MLASLPIVFREVLEAGLIVGIVLAATQGIPRCGVWIAGVLGAAILAGADLIPSWGDEVWNAPGLLSQDGLLGRMPARRHEAGAAVMVPHRTL